jgi:hypothetical protein
MVTFILLIKRMFMAGVMVCGFINMTMATTLVDDIKVNYLTSFHTLPSTSQWPAPGTGYPLSPPWYDNEREQIIGLAGGSIYTMPPTRGHHTKVDGFAMSAPSGFVRHPLTHEIYVVGSKGDVAKANPDGASPQILYKDSESGNIINDVYVLPVFDDVGRLYFMDSNGESLSRLWRFETDQTFTLVYEFPSGPVGQYSHANGFMISNGVIYGLLGYRRGIPYFDTLSAADDFVVGALYRLDPNSSAIDKGFTLLHEFTLDQGEIPWDLNNNYISAYLKEDDQGYLYGGTSVGTCNTKGVTPLGTIMTYLNGVCGGKYQFFSFKNAHLIQTPYPHIDGSNPHGSLYRIKKDGTDFSILHTFSDSDGSQPRGPMTIADGYLYGTTMGGGDHKTYISTRTIEGNEYPKKPLNMTLDGTIYRLKLADIQVVNGAVINSGFEHVHNFKSGPGDDTDGKVPSGLMLADNGRLYGTSRFGGRGYVSNNFKKYQFDIHGTLFEVDLNARVVGGSVNISGTPASIKIGESTELVWSSVNTSDCIPTGGAQGDGWAQDATITPFGSLMLTLEAGTYYYTLNCHDDIKGGRIGAVTTINVSVEGKVSNSERLSYGNGGSIFYLLCISLLLLRHKKGCTHDIE